MNMETIDEYFYLIVHFAWQGFKILVVFGTGILALCLAIGAVTYIFESANRKTNK